MLDAAITKEPFFKENLRESSLFFRINLERKTYDAKNKASVREMIV